MDDRILRAGCLLVGLVLVAVVVYPPAFFGLEQGGVWYEVRVDPADSPAYDDRLAHFSDDGTDESDLSVVQYDELSPAARDLFDGASDQPPEDDGTRAADVRVCKPFTVACPWYSPSELPPELAFDGAADATEAAVIVQTDDGSYLLSAPEAMQYRDGAQLFSDEMESMVRAWILGPIAMLALLTGAGSPVERSRFLALGLVGAVALLAFSTGTNPYWLGIAALVPLVSIAVPVPDDADLRTAVFALGTAAILVALVPPYLSAYVGTAQQTGSVLLVGVALSWLGSPAIGSLARRRADDPLGAAEARRK